MENKVKVPTHRFQEKCDKCGKWSYSYMGYDGKVLCSECVKNKSEK